MSQDTSLDAVARRAAALCRGARVIGIGEHAHGDEVSWAWRLAVMRALARAGHRRLVVLCENVDCLVAGLRRGRQGRRPTAVAFDRNDGDPPSAYPPFTPHLVPGSCRSAVHLAAAREVARLARGRVFGVDVAYLRHAGLDRPPCADRRAYVSRVHAALDVRRRCAAAGPAAAVGGALRNALNAETILAIARDQPAGSTVLYFAHNEHVALACAAARADPTGAYVTEGALLRAALPRGGYRALATYSPCMWAFWGGARPRLHDDRGEPGRPTLPPDEADVALLRPDDDAGDLGGYCTLADFDATLCSAAPPPPRRPPRPTPAISADEGTGGSSSSSGSRPSGVSNSTATRSTSASHPRAT